MHQSHAQHNMPHMCLFTIYKIEIFICGSASTHSDDIYIYMHGIHICICTSKYELKDTTPSFARYLQWASKACWVSNPLNVSCHQGVRLEVGYTMTYDVIMSRVEIVQSYLQKDTFQTADVYWVMNLNEFLWPKLQSKASVLLNYGIACIETSLVADRWATYQYVWLHSALGYDGVDPWIISLEMARGRKIRETMGKEPTCYNNNETQICIGIPWQKVQKR